MSVFIIKIVKHLFGKLNSTYYFVVLLILLYVFFCRCLNKLKQEFVQDLATKYGGERLVEIDMDS